MRLTAAAWFLPVGLAAVLVAVTSVSGSAYQAPGSPPAAEVQVPTASNPETGAEVPGASLPPRSSSVPTPPSAGVPPRSPASSGSAGQAYSTAWPYLNSTPTRQSGYGGTGSPALPPTGRAGVNSYPSHLGARGGGGSFTSQAAAGAMSGSRPSARSAVSSKPYSGYSRKSPVSPYMNLFRSNNLAGTIDNYSTLVRPLLQQQQVNRQTQWDLHSLRSKSGLQGTQLRDLNRRTDGLPDATQQNRYKNYLDYYPRLNR